MISTLAVGVAQKRVVKDLVASMFAFDFTSMAIDFFLAAIGADTKEFHSYKDVCTAAFDFSYIFILFDAVNIYALNDAQEAAVVFATIFGMCNACYHIFTVYQLFGEDICCQFPGVLICMFLVMLFCYLVILSRDLYYADHGWPSERPKLKEL
jgi:hypothetical protein